MGLLASIVNQSGFLSDTFIGDIAGTFGYWVILGGIIAIHAKSYRLAALNCVLFFLLMNCAFYAFEWLVTGRLHLNYLTRWLILSLFTPLGGLLVHNADKRNWLSFPAIAFPVFFLGYEISRMLRLLFVGMIVEEAGVTSIIPATAWEITNDLVQTAIYLAFIIYLFLIFPKSKKRLLCLAATLVATPPLLYFLVFHGMSIVYRLL